MADGEITFIDSTTLRRTKSDVKANDAGGVTIPADGNLDFGTDSLQHDDANERLLLGTSGGELSVGTSQPSHFPTLTLDETTPVPTPIPSRAVLFVDGDGQVKVRKSNGTIVSFEAGGGGSSTFVEDTFVPTLAQTVFNLSSAYLAGGLVVASVGPLVFTKGIHFTISGSVFTWLDTPWTLEAADRVTVRYQTS